MRLLSTIAIALALLLAAALPGLAIAAKAKPAVIAPIGADDRTHLKDIEKYLDGIKTMQSPFLQISSTGEQAQGMLYLSRPGRLRINYEPPVPVIIIANTSYLSYIDTEIKQIQHLPIDDSPASFLLRENFSFSADGVVVSDYAKGAGATRVTLVRSKDPLAGRLTLVFSERPIQLRKWTVVDAQGVVTDVTLLNPRFDFPLPANLFDFDERSLQIDGRN